MKVSETKFAAMEQIVKEMGDLVDKGDFQQVSQTLLWGKWVCMPTLLL